MHAADVSCMLSLLPSLLAGAESMDNSQALLLTTNHAEVMAVLILIHVKLRCRMEARIPSLQDLPDDVRDNILQQAFQQLDQRHRFGVVTLVCRVWHRLALSIAHHIDVSMPTRAAAEPLRTWVAKHGHSLKSISIVVNNPTALRPAWADAGSTEAVVNFLSAAPLLNSLKISHDVLLPTMTGLLNVNLSGYTSLTRLGLVGLGLRSSTISSLLSLRQLSSLDLSFSTFYTRGVSAHELMQQISTSLVQITHLDLDGTRIKPGEFGDPSWFSLKALAPLCSLQHLRKLGSTMLHCDDLSSMGKLPVTYIHIPLLSSDRDSAQFAAWVRCSGHSLEFVSIGVSIAGPTRLRAQTVKMSLEMFTCAPQLKTLRLGNVSLCVAELALLTQLSSLELIEVGLRGAGVQGDLCKTLVMPNLRVLSLEVGFVRDSSVHLLKAGFPQLTDLRVREPHKQTLAVSWAQSCFRDRIVRKLQQRIDGLCKWVYTLLPASPPVEEV